MEIDEAVEVEQEIFDDHSKGLVYKTICHPELVSGSFEVSCIGYTKDPETSSGWQIKNISLC